ncbi:Cortistatin [Manis javanica]|nr:Cortistatin [Manis javanica]
MLFGVTATAALCLEGGLRSHNSRHMQEVTEIKKNSLLSFPTWQYKQISQASAAPFTGGEARKVSKWQEGLSLQRSTQ